MDPTNTCPIIDGKIEIVLTYNSNFDGKFEQHKIKVSMVVINYSIHGSY